MEITPIAYYHGQIGTKFGVPRQGGIAGSLEGRIVFEPTYRNSGSLRGLEGFSRIWLIWGFSKNPARKPGDWQPLVRPPRLGGNTWMGVFATRSPFRPNPLGLSCLEIAGIDLETPDGPVIKVRGADLVDGTPVFDIKPYVAYADSWPDAVSGFASSAPEPVLEVGFAPGTGNPFTPSETAALMEVLSLDPRPAYHPHKPYAMVFAGRDVHFRVDGNRLEIFSIE